MPDEPRVEQFRLSDLGELLAFARRAYPDEPRKADERFWRWHYAENPRADAGDLTFWVARDAGRIVGQLAAIPTVMRAGGRESRALWIRDLILLPEYHGRGLGKRLMRSALDACPTVLALGYNEQSERVLKSLKFVALGGVRRHQRLLFPGNADASVAKVAPLRAALNLLYAPARAGLSKPPAGRFDVREVLEFDDSFDALWRDASTQWTCAVERTSDFLNWQFRRQPGKRFDAVGCYDGETGRLLGYAVLFFRKAGPGGAPPKAAISDLFYGPTRPEGVVDELLRSALRVAVRRRAGSLVTDVRDPLIEGVLRRRGFRLIKRSPQFMAVTTEELGRAVYDPANWFLTRADSDVSIFEEPNL